MSQLFEAANTTGNYLSLRGKIPLRPLVFIPIVFGQRAGAPINAEINAEPRHSQVLLGGYICHMWHIALEKSAAG